MTRLRKGSTDVIPLIPISDVTMEECVDMSKKLGERIGRELGISVYLYGRVLFENREL